MGMGRYQPFPALLHSGAQGRPIDGLLRMTLLVDQNQRNLLDSPLLNVLVGNSYPLPERLQKSTVLRKTSSKPEGVLALSWVAVHA